MDFKKLPATFCILTLILATLPTTGFTKDMAEGLASYQAGHYEEAYKIWLPLAQKGDANAQFNLGLLYRNGFGIKQNDREALGWFSQAAQQGLLDAQYNTGLMYMEGRGVAISRIEAFKWWELAAAKEHADAQHNLAVLYAYGIATATDTTKALDLWHRSAAQGHEGARKALYQAYNEGLFGLKPDKEKAKQWQD